MIQLQANQTLDNIFYCFIWQLIRELDLGIKFHKQSLCQVQNQLHQFANKVYCLNVPMKQKVWAIKSHRYKDSLMELQVERKEEILVIFLRFHQETTLAEQVGQLALLIKVWKIFLRFHQETTLAELLA